MSKQQVTTFRPTRKTNLRITFDRKKIKWGLLQIHKNLSPKKGFQVKPSGNFVKTLFYPNKNIYEIIA